jgi:2-dehydro-3-deoxyphosphogluconate aldolase/(4S)-4-hydroxy-2-oxoglutarate aldolase
MSTAQPVKSNVQTSFAQAPVVGVVRTATLEEASLQAGDFIAAGLHLIEITFSVPQATDLVRRLLDQRQGDGPPWIGMGTVTDAERARQAIDAGTEFIISPNTCPEVAEVVKTAERPLVLGALTCTEIVRARSLGADLVKVYPLPPVGGPDYLSVIRGPLSDIPMLAAGGFGIEEIPSYRQAGAMAFGIGAPLWGGGGEECRRRVARALSLARGEGVGP